MASKKWLSSLVAGAAAIITLSACAGAGQPGNNTNGGNGGQGGTSGESAGLAGCKDDPAGCNSGKTKPGGKITYLVNQGHDGVFMDLTALGNSVYLNQMLQGIYTPVGVFDPTGKWHYNDDLFAKEPELVSKDPMTVKYEIRPEAVWSDGKPINVDDVQFMQKLMSGKASDCKGCQPADTSFFDTTASIEADDADGKNITITYDKGFKHPEWFARSLFELPAHVADEQGFDWKNKPADVKKASDYFLKNPPKVSSGPYVVEKWTVDETQVLKPNPKWYGKTKPSLDQIIKQVVPDQPSWVPATENGELNGGAPSSFTPELQQQFDEIDGISTSVSGSYSWDHVDFNMDSVKDLALRKAIFTAIDNEDARKRIWGDLDELPPMRTDLYLPQSSPYAEDHLSKTGFGTGDVEKARQILKDAGYTGFESGGQLKDKNGKPVPTLRFAFLSGNQNRDTYTQLTQSYLKEIGIKVKPEATPPDQLGTVLSKADYDLVIFGWSGSPLFANAGFQFYNSKSESNFGNLNDPKIDKLTEEARNQISLDDSAKVVQQIVDGVFADAYILPLWDTPNFMWVSDDYVNMRDNGADAGRTYYNSGEWGSRAE
jgi:peptide/nickel transport system substrate-binding protein